ncbi:Nitronate monooxygenase [Clostridioides difficile]|nr:Nitronate monooxygenase [Clostridioides difficile]
MLGAEGVQVGTRFLVARECTVNQNYKDKILKAKDIDTEVTGRSTGHPVRVLKNKLSRMYTKLEKE